VMFDEKMEATPKAIETVSAATITGKRRRIGLFARRPDRHAIIDLSSRHAPSCAVSEFRRIACRWW
jgi:hypothetical protein